VQNAFIASFNGRLRDEFLNETQFSSLVQARVLLANSEFAPSNGGDQDSPLPIDQDAERNKIAQFFDLIGAPKGNRTPVFAVKGRRPRPLDDGRGRWRRCLPAKWGVYKRAP
jgi:hypothetical protein